MIKWALLCFVGAICCFLAMAEVRPRSHGVLVQSIGKSFPLRLSFDAKATGSYRVICTVSQGLPDPLPKHELILFRVEATAGGKPIGGQYLQFREGRNFIYTVYRFDDPPAGPVQLTIDKGPDFSHIEGRSARLVVIHEPEDFAASFTRVGVWLGVCGVFCLAGLAFLVASAFQSLAHPKVMGTP